MKNPPVANDERAILRSLADNGPRPTIPDAVRGRLFLYSLIDEPPRGWVITDQGKDYKPGDVIIWDLLFGTFYLPKAWPAAYGTETYMPPTVTGQLLEPFAPTRPRVVAQTQRPAAVGDS